MNNSRNADILNGITEQFFLAYIALVFMALSLFNQCLMPSRENGTCRADEIELECKRFWILFSAYHHLCRIIRIGWAVQAKSHFELRQPLACSIFQGAKMPIEAALERCNA